MSSYEALQLKDLMRPKSAIYWADLIISSAIIYACAFELCRSDPFSLKSIVLLLVTTHFAVRVGNFIHEIQHSAKKIKGFELGYNIIFGWLWHYPTYIYDRHYLHHQHSKYGTVEDPEFDLWGTPPNNLAPIFLLK